MDRIKLSDCKLNLDNLKNIICIGTFGSYNEDCFDKNRSDMCETYLISTDNLIPNKSGSDIVQVSSDFGFISKEDSKNYQTK